MKILLLISFLMFQFDLFSQNLPVRPFEKIVYAELVPEWHFTNYDNEMDNGIFDGYNNFTSIAGFEPLIVDNSIFELFFR